MFLQGIDGEGGFSSFVEYIHRFDQPVTQNADAPQAPFPKPAPMGEQARHIDDQRHVFEQRAERADKFLALCWSVEMVTGKIQISHAPTGLAVEMAEVIQIKIASEHM